MAKEFPATEIKNNYGKLKNDLDFRGSVAEPKLPFLRQPL